MKRKFFLLLALTFLMCGCTAEVNLNIKDSAVLEEIIIDVSPNSEYSKDQLKSSFRDYIPIYASDIIPDTEPDKKVSGISYYQKKVQEVGNGYRFNYSNRFKLEDYQNAKSIKDGFKSSNVNFNKKEKTILISTDNNGLLYFNKYPLLNEVKINITSNYIVKESNADSVNNNVYTWILNKDKKKNIYMLIDQSQVRTEIGAEIDDDSKIQNDKNDKDTEKIYRNDFEKFLNEHPFIVIIGALIIFIIFILIIKKISK